MGYKTYTCPLARSCGGCEWLAVPYPIQLKRKQAYIEELFALVALEDGALLGNVHGMAEPLAYRHKAAAAFAPAKGGRLRSGLFVAGSHRIVPCSTCLAEHPQARVVLNTLAREAEALGIRAYDEDRGTGSLRHAIVRCAWKTDELLLTVVNNGPELKHERTLMKALRDANLNITSMVLNVNQRKTNAMLGSRSRVLFGSGFIRDELLGCSFEIGATSFYQTNPAQTEVLYRLAIEMAGITGRARVLDAYCGTGTIGICLASQLPNVELVGVETGAEAVRAARKNAMANNVAGRARFVRGDATHYMKDAQARGERFDVVILDPPRAGATEAFLQAVDALALQRVVYVSCNPQTLARDITLLRARGWKLQHLEPVDMFPHTKHVECVALLARG